MATAEETLLDDPLYNVNEISEWLRVTKYTLYNMIKNDKIPKPLKFGRQLYWRKSTIEKWIEDCQT